MIKPTQILQQPHMYLQKNRNLVLTCGLFTILIFRHYLIEYFKEYIYIERNSIETGGNLASVKQEIKYYNEQLSKLK